MRQHPVCAAHWLRTLKMCVCRHQIVFERNCLLDHNLLQRTHRLIQIEHSIHHPEPRRSRDLVVSASSRVKLRCDVADLLVQHAIDHGVNIFVGLLGQGSFRQSLAYLRKTALQLPAFIEREHSRTPQRHRPRPGKADVMRP